MRLVLASFFLLSGCHLGGGGDGYPDDTSVVIRTGDCPGESTLAESVSYVGTTLTVSAFYGGCETTRLWACWDGDIGGGGPTPYQAAIDIHYEPAGDCDALHSSSVTFSITPIVGDVTGFSNMLLTVGGASVSWERRYP